MRSIQIQTTTPWLHKGDILQLKVGISPKTEKPCFIPEFEGKDMMAKNEDTVRFFNPINEAELNEGEVWEVEIQDFHVSNIKSKDDRLYVFVYVEIRKRIEDTKQWIESDLTGDWLYVEKKSGTRIFSINKYPLAVKRMLCRKNGFAIEAYIYSAGSIVIKVNDFSHFSRNEYVEMLVRNGLGKISPESAAKAFEKLPLLPEADSTFC